MADRFKFAEVRQEVIEMLKKDLLGPSSENEILNQNPRFEYIVGMLAPQTSENDSNEQADSCPITSVLLYSFQI